jgi:DNA repair protein RecN (Recombination protein N)
MLQFLTINNFAIVKKLEIEWHKGMTTITGETGAGKSIAIDALGLCLGDRATTNVVRPGSKKTEICATFDVLHNKAASNWLSIHELEQDNECILRRVITADGRSSAFINGTKVPLLQLKEISQYLINIHGQHDHQLLTKQSEQQKILDQYANNRELLTNVSFHYQQWRKLTTELQELQQSQQQREANRQLLQYQVTELDEFNLQENEFEALEREYQKQGSAQQLLNESIYALHKLSQDEQFNIIDQLNSIHDKLINLTVVDSNLSPITELLNNAVIQLQEANIDLQHYHDRLELNPEEFDILEERYSLAIQLAKKHQIKPEQLYHQHLSLKSALATISSDDDRVNYLVDEIASCEQNYYAAANLLSDAREQAALKLNKLITTSMQELSMPHGNFCIKITKDKTQNMSPYGLNNIEFLVSMNPGQPLEAMHKVASGGELSRISLAMQVVLAEKVTSPAMIFDEVDVGISGSTAAVVGKKLKQLGTTTQVICVTHLPQVASKGDQQLFVTKLTDGEQTETQVIELNKQGRVREIARLLAGDKITDNSLANAQELLAS